ncbi:MAG: hypothetical protein AAF490_07115 [Chloroflexota bacterium]
MDIANNIFIPLSLCGFVFLLFGLLAVFALRRQRHIKRAWQQVADQFGMLNHKPDAIYPQYHGRFNRVDVGLDVIYQDIVLTRSDSTTGISRTKTKRPWTRVFADLEAPPGFELRSRRQKVEDASQYLAQATGDKQFDEMYELFLPRNTAVSDILTPQLKQTLLEANTPIHIYKQKVFWSKVRLVTDTVLLENALQTCAAVAATINEQTLFK